jgi:hypothetical protein
LFELNKPKIGSLDSEFHLGGGLCFFFDCNIKPEDSFTILISLTKSFLDLNEYNIFASKYNDSEMLYKSLIPAFKLLTDSYDKNFLDVAKLTKYKDIKIVITKAYQLDGASISHLCTFLNNTIIDWLEIYSEGDAEYNGRTGAALITSFSITSNYEISVKTALYPEPSNMENELDATQNTYIISDGGKFVKK